MAYFDEDVESEKMCICSALRATDEEEGLFTQQANNS